ncbi:MAG TPA: hypothetical protein VGC60_06740 [Pyrinomonadaceae bacterium]|jgi:hypothetical protein
MSPGLFQEGPKLDRGRFRQVYWLLLEIAAYVITGFVFRIDFQPEVLAIWIHGPTNVLADKI